MNNNDYSGLESQELDDFMELDDDTPNSRHETDTGYCRSESVAINSTDENLSSGPSTYETNSRKRKSTSASYPHFIKFKPQCGNFSGKHQPWQEVFPPQIRVEESTPDISTFGNVVTSDKNNSASSDTKKNVAINQQCSKGIETTQKDISFGMKNTTVASSMAAELESHNPKGINFMNKNTVDRPTFVSYFANHTHTELCEEHGVYKSKCEMCSSSRTNCKPHCHICSS